jgi:glycosyltransferase involved in cell wall biosynthesis
MENFKICIFINNYGTSNIKLPDLSLSNPGMGGTQYEMFLLIQLLAKSNIDLTVFLTHNQQFETNIKYRLVDNIEEVFNICNKENFDYAILRANDGLKNLNILNKTKIIYWVHNFIGYKSATCIAKNEHVAKVVFVSQEEADFYYDHDISKKGKVIFNAIPKFNKKNQIKEKENIVTFIGDLSPYKKFDKLTKIWPKIVSKVPNAKLLVLGSGDLYGKGKTFGKYGYAEEHFENRFMKPIIKHNLQTTVEFAGLVKGNMPELISKSKVTVFMNPIETFCIAATDSIANKVPVVCPKSTGYCDVVTNNTGYLFTRKNQIVNVVVRILKSNKQYNMTNEDLRYLESFSPETYLSSWLNLFAELNPSKVYKKRYHKKNYSVNHKWIPIVLDKIRTLFHLPNGFSRIGIKWYLRKIIRKN